MAIFVAFLEYMNFICPSPKFWYFDKEFFIGRAREGTKKLIARGTKYDNFGVPDCILRYAYIIWSFLWPLLTAKAKIIEHTLLVRECVNISVMRVGSDTFSDPIFQNSLQN